ncbi:heavy metal translocating P-type ATPase [Haloarchaeobius sp. HRN-SO-5]|uniref:heavy metal translocating P-type ATPase n=1 Tax=Haloarchaeobius sp. HRN-SO-5 TaxID=3446118 RepID=UPI003EBBF8BB
MSCDLCDLPTPDPPVTAGDVEGEFCCRGCLAVSREFDDLDDARAVVDEDEDEGEADADEGALSDGETAYVRVDGMHCTTCEAFLEHEAGDEPGVVDVETNYANDLARVVYDPSRLREQDLPGLFDRAGYSGHGLDEEEGDDGSELLRLLVGGFFGMMTMLWYVLILYPTYLGLDAQFLLADLSGSFGGYLLANVFVNATVVLVFTGRPILRGAYVSLRAGHPNMDLLVSLAAVNAYLYSTATMLLGGVDVYFDITVVVVMAVAVGNYYEARVKRRAAGTLADLTGERVTDARRRTGTGTETVPVEALTAGDELLVKPGERIPVDGDVVEGTAAVDESLLTGESVPVRVEPGDPVPGGGVVTDAPLVVAVDEGGASTIDRLVTLLWDVQAGGSRAQRLADRLAGVFVPLVVLVAVLAVGVQLATGASVTAALLTGLAVLVVSCPCALGLATPLAVASGVTAALDRGIVVGDGSVFEDATETDTVVFDKTGTLTTGDMRVHRVDGGDEVLARAGAVERLATHPIADAVADAAPETDADVTAFENHPGRGVSADVDDNRVVVGHPDLFAARGWSIPDFVRDGVDDARADGDVPVVVGWDGRARGLVVVGDDPRDGWAAVVSRLADRGKRVVVLTGDDERAAERFRDHEAVADVFAGVPPEGKVAVVERLAADGTVAMVGDGSNDAPALAVADVGIALDSGTALAADAADVVVTSADLDRVPEVFSLTTGARRRIRENLTWALGYNALAIPAAALGYLNPLVAAVAMAASSLLVVGNSSRRL